jgi:3-oxoacyl-[acyl-carrier protein] reductase
VGVGQTHAARLALAGAIASLVREVAPYNVTINSVLPGLVETPALKNALTGRAESRGVPYEEVEKDVRLRCAANRLAKPEELGDLIVMLCAAQMGYLTGQNVVSDGGAYQGLF